MCIPRVADKWALWYRPGGAVVATPAKDTRYCYIHYLQCLSSSAFEPIIQRFLKYLSGWAAKHLSCGARLTLISSTLDALVTHFMSVFRIHQKINRKLDAVHRSLFCRGNDFDNYKG